MIKQQYRPADFIGERIVKFFGIMAFFSNITCYRKEDGMHLWHIKFSDQDTDFYEDDIMEGRKNYQLNQNSDHDKDKKKQSTMHKPKSSQIRLKEEAKV